MTRESVVTGSGAARAAVSEKTVYDKIINLLELCLTRYEAGSDLKNGLEEALKKFVEKGLHESQFDDSRSIAELNTVLQAFLNKDKREISVKASEGGRSEETIANELETLLDHFKLIKEMPMPNPEGKAIAIFGSSMGLMEMRLKWVLKQLEKFSDLSERPQIVFLTGDRAAFLNMLEEKEILVKIIAEKISRPKDEIKALLENANKEAETISSMPEHKQTILPLLIMRKVNEIVAGSFILEGLEELDLQDLEKAQSLLKMALVERIYPSETVMAEEIAKKYDLGENSILYSNEISKGYRATTLDNANRLFEEIIAGKINKNVMLVSNNPFCRRQFLDVENARKILDIRSLGHGIELDVCGFGNLDKRVNPDTVLDCLARDVYAINKSLELASPSTRVSVGGLGGGATAVATSEGAARV